MVDQQINTAEMLEGCFYYLDGCFLLADLSIDEDEIRQLFDDRQVSCNQCPNAQEQKFRRESPGRP
jgi:hypothetical protein